MLPVTVDGESLKLALITYKPVGSGPFPTLIFHHGSTGRGDDGSLFAKPYVPSALTHWFVTRGWAVLLPSRRGRGGSEGRYDEGFATMRSRGYTCEPTWSLPGADRALRDIDAVTSVLLGLSFVDRTRVAVGGQSRGGLLSVTWSGHRPAIPQAVINFVGGWMGRPCQYASEMNRKLLVRGAAYAKPMIWLYGDNDSYYPLSDSRAAFTAFQSAGGKGSFHEFIPPLKRNGHDIVWMPELWTSVMEAYLAKGGLPVKVN